jgi:hypothetical protein
VAWRIRDDELAAGRREITVRDINRDALLALGAKAIREVGEVDLSSARDVGRALERLDLRSSASI